MKKKSVLQSGWNIWNERILIERLRCITKHANEWQMRNLFVRIYTIKTIELVSLKRFFQESPSFQIQNAKAIAPTSLPK